MIWHGAHGNSRLSAKKWECSVKGAETQSRDREVRKIFSQSECHLQVKNAINGVHGIYSLTVRVKECSVEGADTQSATQTAKKNLSQATFKRRVRLELEKQRQRGENCRELK